MRRNSRETDSWQFLSKVEISSWRYPKRAFLNQISRGPRGNSQAHWRKELEPQFYLTVYRIVRSLCQTDFAWNYKAIVYQSNLSSFENWLKDFSLKLKNCISFWKNKNMKWNGFGCSLMWCVLLSDQNVKN